MTDAMQDFDARYAREQREHRERVARILWQGRVDRARSAAAHERMLKDIFGGSALRGASDTPSEVLEAQGCATEAPTTVRPVEQQVANDFTHTTGIQ